MMDPFYPPSLVAQMIPDAILSQHPPRGDAHRNACESGGRNERSSLLRMVLVTVGIRSTEQEFYHI